MRPSGEKIERPLTFGGGGWVIAVALLLSAVLVAWALSGVFVERPSGDGRTIESYGFDLSALAVPRSTVRPGMPHRDMVHPIEEPRLLVGRRVADLAPRFGKELVPTDRVIGVALGGEARAYPLAILDVHEIVHDTLGGTPIAVTYSWPCDSAAVYDRRVGGETLSFGVSGLLCNANTLMYDRGATTASLWQQITGEAVSGPRAGERLEPVASALVSWEQWLTLHPDSTVVGREPGVLAGRYNKADPDTYFKGRRPLQPVDPPPPPPPPSPMDRIVAVTADGVRRVYPVSLIAARRDGENVWRVELGGATVRFWYSPAAETVYVDGADARYALWFAWHAFHPADEVVAR